VHEVATGRNVVVAEIDTGVEIDHPDLAGQIIATENFVDGRPYTPEAHGTAVAGIIAAIANNRLGIAGVAPQARLMVLRGCWQEQAGGSARCNSFTLAKALQFALDKKPDVINMSLGGPPDRLLSRLLDAAVERGMVVVAAIDPSRADSFPASHPGVLAVASEDAGMPASGVLVAPGRDVPTTMTGRRWDFVQGSSYAAAHVTGVVALLRQLSPASDARRIRESLQPPQAHPAADRAQMMDVCALVTRAADVCVCACGAARQASAIQVR
jgi:subtilisin family serine protease